MQKNQRILLYLLVLLAGAAWITISAGTTIETGKTSAPQAGFTAPDFMLKTPEAKNTRCPGSKASRVVNFWATWCPPCRAEMPAIEKMYREYKDQGLVVLAVNMTYQDDLEGRAICRNMVSPFPSCSKRQATVGAAYQLRSLPSSYFINRAGIIQEVVIGGPMSEALLRTRIEQILK